MDYKIFGCRVNKYYTNKRLNYLRSLPAFQENDKVLLASCMVTDRAKKKRLKELEKHLQEGKKVYLTGCGAFDKGDRMDYEDFYKIYPHLEPYKENIVLLGEEPGSEEELFEEDLSRENIYTKKFVVVQNGCDSGCSFCLSIKKRGGSRNRKLSEILDEINSFVKEGGKEIVLTGINLASRGCFNTKIPEESNFAYLLKKILEKTDIPRIRLSSLGPEFLGEKFFEVVSNERVLPHFHLSVQSFSDKILSDMSRNYSADDLESVLEKIRNLDRNDREYISIGADIMVGFPGETEEEFQKTLDGLKKYRINKIHVFPFSPHIQYEHVPATYFEDQITQEVKEERKKKIMELEEKLQEEFENKNKGKKWDVLFENKKGGKWIGWTPNYLQVSREGNYKKGDVINLKF